MDLAQAGDVPLADFGAVEERVGHGGDERHGGGLFLLDQAQDAGRIEAADHHLFEPVKGGALRAAPSVGMEERDGVELDHGLVVVEGGRDGEHMKVEGAMGEGDALRRASGAGGVKQLGDFAFVKGEEIGALDAATRDQLFVRLAGFDPALDAGAGLAQVLDEGREIGLVDEDARFGVVQDIGQFRGGEAHVERHDDGADERGGEIAFEQLVGIEAEVGDAVAGKDALGEQAEGEAFDAFAEFGVGEAAVSADDAGLLSVEVYCAVEGSHWRQWHVHVLEIVSGDRAAGGSF